MRVAINVEQLLHEAPGGIGRYTAELTRLLPGMDGAGSDGVSIVAFTARHSRAAVGARLAANGISSVRTVILPLPRPLLYDAWHVLGAGGPIGRTGPVELVHAPSVAVPPTGSVPLVVTVHDVAPLVMPEAFTRRGRWFHGGGIRSAERRADLVIAVSEAAAGEIVEHTSIRRDRIRVVPLGVDHDRAGPGEIEQVRRGLDLGDLPYVVWVGVDQPRKNVATLVEAFGRVRGLPHQLVLAGPRGWKGSDAVLPRDARVRRIGAVAPSAMPALLAGAALLAFPSRHEGFGLPVLEAMAQGTPVVCSDIAPLREVAGGAARLVAPDDIGGWAEGLEVVLTDDDVRARLSAAGLVRAAEFTWARCAERTLAVYREAVMR